MNMSQINRRAWEIRKTAANHWGCPVMEIVWRPCFIEARKEIEMNQRMADRINTLKGIGGNEWMRGEYHRIYFDLGFRMEAIGLSINTYKTGNISSASLDGERISNNKAKKTINALGSNYGKFWYDVSTGEFGWKEIDPDLAEQIIDAINEKIAA